MDDNMDCMPENDSIDSDDVSRARHLDGVTEIHSPNEKGVPLELLQWKLEVFGICSSLRYLVGAGFVVDDSNESVESLMVLVLRL